MELLGKTVAAIVMTVTGIFIIVFGGFYVAGLIAFVFAQH